MTQYYSHGKLLLSGEYLVLVGAQALAVPCKMGQSLEFEANDSKILKWESWDHQNETCIMWSYMKKEVKVKLV